MNVLDHQWNYDEVKKVEKLYYLLPSLLETLWDGVWKDWSCAVEQLTLGDQN